VGSARLRRRIAISAALAVTLEAAVVFALPLHDLVARARGSVVHLSVRDSSNEEQGSGSGFVISEDGRLATNFHVVEGASRVVAVFSNRAEVEVAGLRWFDADLDIAVLALAPGKYPALPLATAPAKQGDPIVVIGSPLGLGEAVSTGIVSAVREHGTARPGRSGEASWGLQISAPTAPGSSGSPILNEHAEVVGLAVGSVRGEALYFGIPVAMLQKLLDTGPGELRPLGAARKGGSSLRTNLLISAAVIGTLVFVSWLISVVLRRSDRRTKKARI
jgi:S1-C subfamily serine protease